MSSTLNDFLTVNEAADLLRVSVSTIRRWIRDGSLPAHRAGKRRVLLKRGDLEQSTTTITAGSGGDHQRAFIEMPESTQPAVMYPESWETINESRDLRTEQIMGEDVPWFNEFELGPVADMIVHSPDRPRQRPVTAEDQQRRLFALEQATRTRARISRETGVERFPPSWTIIAEMRDERTRQLVEAHEPDLASDS